MPTHVSWSADGSLFAVSVGPHVALYDGNTNALHQVLTCSDCQHATSAHFVGTSSRYIAVVGHNDVMVWDLLTRSCASLALFTGVYLTYSPSALAICELACDRPGGSPSDR